MFANYQRQDELVGNTDSRAEETSVNPVGQPGKFDLVFDDEFNGTTLDSSKWADCKWWAKPEGGCNINGDRSLEWYLPKNVTVANGELTMQANREDYTDIYGGKHGYTSGMIISQDTETGPAKFSFAYGYAEARIKVSKGAGLWSTFWMDQVDGVWPPEVDVAENRGAYPNLYEMNLHYSTPTAPHLSAHVLFNGPDLTSDFHTVGLFWQKDKMGWYLDGVLRGQFVDAAYVPNKPLYLIFNLAVGGYGGTVAKETVFPAKFVVDYVRVWKEHATTRLMAKVATKANGQQYLKASWKSVDSTFPNFEHFAVGIYSLSGEAIKEIDMNSQTSHNFPGVSLNNGKYNLTLKTFFSDGTVQTDSIKFRYKNGTYTIL